MSDLYNKAQEAVDFIKSKIGDFQPLTAIVLGSGLGGAADEQNQEQEIIIEAKDIPGWPVSTAPSHAGKLIFKNIDGRDIVILQGRVHYYEGYSMQEVTFPTRVICMLGIKEYIATNASGGISHWLQSGDIVAVTDHINLMGANPLRGADEPRWNVRFPDMTHAYSPRLLDLMERAASLAGVHNLKRGVYAAFAGPSFETPAEVKMAKILGADLAGMSTVPEIIVANAMGVECGALSCVANKAAGLTGEKLTAQEVLDNMAKSAGALANLLKNLIHELNLAK